ncbi:hypothetical protein ABZV65_04340 [Streptomyces bauhiniae]|uniref:hypothetical protein n=1 Tax=Streptomyces bauhiniae TaxID=2340725 RepID=UPI0033A8CEEC
MSELVDCTPLFDMAATHAAVTHPAPFFDDDLRTIQVHERCGFNSREALDCWFAGWTGPLSECGFRVWVYEVPDGDVRVGAVGGQVVFDPAHAELIETHELEAVA